MLSFGTKSLAFTALGHWEREFTILENAKAFCCDFVHFEKVVSTTRVNLHDNLNLNGFFIIMLLLLTTSNLDCN